MFVTFGLEAFDPLLLVALELPWPITPPVAGVLFDSLLAFDKLFALELFAGNA